MHQETLGIEQAINDRNASAGCVLCPKCYTRQADWTLLDGRVSVNCKGCDWTSSASTTRVT
ncbi:60S ribosomal export protein NMD3 [Patescibacteria group bacterium]|nr:60S ribosomal export protein NMD3 [Patescibacteria group bacterium]